MAVMSLTKILGQERFSTIEIQGFLECKTFAVLRKLRSI